MNKTIFYQFILRFQIYQKNLNLNKIFLIQILLKTIQSIIVYFLNQFIYFSFVFVFLDKLLYFLWIIKKKQVK